MTPNEVTLEAARAQLESGDFSFEAMAAFCNAANKRVLRLWSWRDAPDLMERLTTAQNHLKAPIDIVTFAGFCDSRDELLKHVERYEREVAEQEA